MKKVLSVVLTVLLIGFLLMAVVEMPPFGAVDNPAHNEVKDYYLENGAQETGATNIIAAIILEYRAFDTFGEACVLFAAIVCTLMVTGYGKEKGDHHER